MLEMPGGLSCFEKRTYIDPTKIVEMQSTAPSTSNVRPLHDPTHGIIDKRSALLHHCEDVIVLEVLTDLVLDLGFAQTSDGPDYKVVQTLVVVSKNAYTSSLIFIVNM